MNSLKTVRELNFAVTDVARKLELPEARVRTTLIGVVTAQMLPASVALKGGLAIKMKLGEIGTRATSDLDGVFMQDSEMTLQKLRDLFELGWGSVPPSKKQRRQNPQAPDRVAFTGTVTEKAQHDPGVRRPEYLMHPVKVTLNFLGKPWGTIDLELAHPEVHNTLESPTQLDEDLIEVFEDFGFGKLTTVSFVAVELQIAQKIHALTHPASDRSHDLVDLQLLWTEEVSMKAVKRACEKTFRYRNEHQWPPLPLRSMHADRARYNEAVAEVRVGSEHTAVLAELNEARDWLANKLRALHHGRET